MPAPRSHADEPRPGDVLSLDLSLLDDNPFQPRTEMDPAKLEELAASLKQTGLIQPIAVSPNGPGRYHIVAGHRRVAAFRKLLAEASTEAARRDYQLIRAHVVEALSDSQMAISAYVENVQRDNLNPLDEAAALARIRELGANLSAPEVAKVTGQPERRVRRLLKLADAPQVVKGCVASGLLVEVSEGGQPARRERRRFDLFAALEFVRLHEHHLRRKASTADERTRAAMERALTDGWGVRRIQSHVEGLINGRNEAQTEGAPSALEKKAGSPLPSVPAQFLIQLGRLKDATAEQLGAARRALEAALDAVDEQLQTLGTT
jgi:ParB family chromosome partitioning protein